MYTFPNEQIIDELYNATPEHLVPNRQPWIVVEEGYLSAEECNKIVQMYEDEEKYHFPHCKATTQECPRPLNSVLKPITDFLHDANAKFWNYDVDSQSAWMQTYHYEDRYDLHMDGAIGQTRKLTAIAILSNSRDYVGGHLVIRIPPHEFVVPKIQGTIVAFPHWITHEVLTIQRGCRRTINLGFWGPPFK